MRFDCPYWDDYTKYDLLARWIILHSYVYYELNENLVSDKMYDDNVRQFLELAVDQNRFKKCAWYYVMHDFDGSTGFHLFKRLEKMDKRTIKRTAQMLLGMKYKNEK